MAAPAELDLSEAVQYHYDRFPPRTIEWERLIGPLADAAAALARYDQMLKGMHNSEIFLAPLRQQEAVISSRMEGTISTLDEILRIEADQDDNDDPHQISGRGEAIEVFLYSRAMRIAQRSMEENAPLSKWLIRSAHRMLLSFGRGAGDGPREFKTTQNYLGDRGRKKIHFVPINPERLNDGLDALFSFMEASTPTILIRTAIAHVEFESLHPFNDGNGRIGRMIIPLMLWEYGAISAPHFYISAFFEENRGEYIDRMRSVSADDAWTDWIAFFLEAMKQQADHNLEKAEQIRKLYEKLKIELREILSSQWTVAALDFMFSKPVFRNSAFAKQSAIPEATARRFTRELTERGILVQVEEAAGRRSAVLALEPLLALVRS